MRRKSMWLSQRQRIYIYIYREREREGYKCRDREATGITSWYAAASKLVQMSQVDVKRERDRDGDRQTDRQAGRQTGEGGGEEEGGVISITTSTCNACRT